jgi:hypothetical protein
MTSIVNFYKWIIIQWIIIFMFFLLLLKFSFIIIIIIIQFVCRFRTYCKTLRQFQNAFCFQIT